MKFLKVLYSRLPLRAHFSYKQKLAISIFLFAVLPLSFSGFLYIKSAWDKQVKETLRGFELQLDNSITLANDLFSRNIEKFNNIKSNYQLRYFLTTDFSNDLDGKYEYHRNIAYFLGLLSSNNDRSTVTLYASNFPLRDSASGMQYIDFFDVELRNEILQSKEALTWRYTPRVGSTGIRQHHITMYGSFFYLPNTPAIMEASIPFETLEEKFAISLPEGGFIVYASHGNQYFEINRKTKSQKEIDFLSKSYLNNFKLPGYHVICKEIKINADKVLIFIPEAYVNQSMREFILLGILLVAAVLGLILLSVNLTSRLLTRRLNLLVSEISRDIESTPDASILKRLGNGDEFDKISLKYFDLINKIRNSYEEMSQLQFQKKSFELSLLQERINPHFLYNSLSTIKWVFYDPRLETFIDALVKYYRISLSKGNIVIPVSQEIDMIKQYLYIQKFVFASDFEYTFDVDADILERKILKNLLQPLVENALIHGIMPLESGGVLRVGGRIEEGKILLTIADNGAGMDRDVLAHLLSDETVDKPGGYGLKNVQNRIRLFFGDDYGMRMESTPGRGTTVTLTIPEHIESYKY